MKKVRKDGKGRVLHRGEVYIRSKGLYCFSYTDVWGKRRYVYAADLPELRDKEEELNRDKLDKLTPYPVSKVDLNYVFDRYFTIKTNLKSSTRANYAFNYDHYIRNGFGKRKIDDIHYSDVLTFYNALAAKGLSTGMIASIHRLIHPALDLAKKDNVIKSNPSDGAMSEIRKNSDKPEHREALTLEQQRVFLSLLDKPEFNSYKNLFIVLFGTGVRIGELTGLRWCDVDFENSVISINHNVSYYRRLEYDNRSAFRVTLPKTAAGIRTIPMLDRVREALLEEKKIQDETGHHAIVEIDGMKGFIFSNKYGMLHNHNSLDRVIRKIVRLYNAKETEDAEKENREPFFLPHFSCHITRHSFCTRLIENDVNVKVVQTTMGHKDIRTTLDTYADVSEKKKKEAFKLLDSIVF